MAIHAKIDLNQLAFLPKLGELRRAEWIDIELEAADMNIVPTTAQDNGSIAKELLYCWHFKRLRIAIITATPQLQFDYPILG